MIVALAVGDRGGVSHPHPHVGQEALPADHAARCRSRPGRCRRNPQTLQRGTGGEHHLPVIPAIQEGALDEVHPFGPGWPGRHGAEGAERPEVGRDLERKHGTQPAHP